VKLLACQADRGRGAPARADKGERVVRIRRVRLADGVHPLLRRDLPTLGDRQEKIITDNLKDEPIFSLLERKYDVPLIEAEVQIGRSGR